MQTSNYLKLNIMGESDDADITKVAENFSKIDEAAETWSNFGNTGTVLETESDFQIANEFPVPADENAIFAITVKMPRAYAEGDTITVAGIAYILYQGTDPALSEAWKAGEVVTINFDKTSRRCWASAGGGAPRPLPAQVSNMAASVPEGETPSIVFTWTNPVDENFAGMILVVKEGSAPNGVTDGVQVYKGTGTTFTYTDGVQWDHTYFGRGFAYNSQNKYQMDATGAIASATPSNIPDQVSGVELVGNKGSATLTWTNPTNLSYSVTKVIQKIESDPESPTDGTEVYSGTGTETTVSGLQDSINYHFGIFALSEDGQYKPPVTKTYTPQIWPKYDYTGNHTLLKDNADLGNWRIKFLSAGTLTWLADNTQIDVFLVGGGAYGDKNGGGGGYTKTEKNVTIEKNQEARIEIGSGGYNSGGGTSQFIVNEGVSLSAAGGNGQSGGSNGGYFSDGGTAGNGGTDGTPGQGTTTREFGDVTADLYSGGGGGGAKNGKAGTGGNGTPVLAKRGYSYNGGFGDRYYGGGAGGGYGGGGGGVPGNNQGTSGSMPGTGAQGIVIIRNART